MDVSKLIADLAASGVASFKGYGIEIEFHRHREPPTPTSGLAAWLSNPDKPEPNKEQPKQELAPSDAGLAQSVDAELPYDKVLNWSASPDPSEQPTPLTGDAAAVTSEPS